MLIEHINPIFLYKLLKTPQKMRTLLTYLKMITLCYNKTMGGRKYPRLNIKDPEDRRLSDLKIQSVIGNQMNKCNNILISDT